MKKKLRFTGNVPDKVTEHHESEVTIVPGFAHLVFQRELADVMVCLFRRVRVIVKRLPLVQAGRVIEQLADRDLALPASDESLKIQVDRIIEMNLPLVDQHHYPERRSEYFRQRG